jgi:hypothetical protein
VGRNGVKWCKMHGIAPSVRCKWGSWGRLRVVCGGPAQHQPLLNLESYLLFGVFLCNVWCVMRTYLPHQV